MVDLTYFSANFLFKNFVDGFFLWVSVLVTKNLVSTAPEIIYRGAICSVILSLIYYAIRIMAAIRSHDLNKMKIEEQRLKNEIAKKQLENLNQHKDDNENITEI
jgi:hypothetical protein